ncbi:GGDEF domain-containing protein [Colwellia psychrerythraea]|uniref:diguanylate cyclase n=1 Tax=Colwellia psychrerythraea (strain 34H / ATCC BAA-681) TaxID=167879 RepID=Q484P0_COLP3|nr:GGDEF domain-containing protein [Colwellia psychrerythraea]AAZ26974.1 metal-binding diguanylate cyclase (GGDEF) domain protein [Colwellia psychrerythraea 34H]
MKTFIWNSNYETGVAKVDDQHQCLVEIINEYSHLLANNTTTETDIELTLNKLIDYTKFHFKDEEQLMYSVGLDTRHITHHEKLHRDILDEISTLLSDQVTDKLSIARYILDLIIHWLVYHILGTDMNMAKQMKAIQGGLSARDAYDFEEKIKDKSTEPLLEALNALFIQISERNKDLMELNKTLEAKVISRTQQLSERNKELAILSLTDPLTNMANRRHAMQQLTLLWEESVNNNLPLSCLMIDVDYFKQINDTHGHDIGDVVLIELARVFQHAIRTDDIACRLGGDEFFIICPATELEGGLLIAELINEQVESLSIDISDSQLSLSTSIGVATKTAQMTSIEDLMKAADDGVYSAKSNGRGCTKSIQ